MGQRSCASLQRQDRYGFVRQRGRKNAIAAVDPRTESARAGRLMMARRLTAVLGLAAFCMAFLITVAPARTRQPRTLTCTATAYSVRGETADGDVTKPGQTVAADPAFIPLGSQIK